MKKVSETAYPIVGGSTATRRALLAGMGAAAGTFLAAPAVRALEWDNNYYPDPRVRVLDPAGSALRHGNAGVQRLATGFNFTEGPVWFGDFESLVFSDLMDNRLYVWDDMAREIRVFRDPSFHVNGNTKDRENRLISCEQMNRRVTRTEHDGSITVIADSFEGKKLNSPNDACVRSDGTIWFSDPPNGIGNDYEGRRAEREQANTNVFRVDPETGDITAMVTDIRPNGICFSPDETKLYVSNFSTNPRDIKVYDVVNDGKELANGRTFVTNEASFADGIRCDWNGNLWASWGSAPGEMGVRAFSPEGVPLLQIELPERAANVCFGGPVGNRLFITAQQSLYSLYVATRGAVY